METRPPLYAGEAAIGVPDGVVERGKLVDRSGSCAQEKSVDGDSAGMIGWKCEGEGRGRGRGEGA